MPLQLRNIRRLHLQWLALVGAVTSSTITFCVAVDVLPLPSSNVQVMA
ncbi:MAG: hypothetical protein IPI36_07670 [Chitinophagaceae bacterium]|nr:hypothetical protein [Chitinophagaceae bacterium]